MKILFCGPIPLAGATPHGGYEACNRRTIDALRASGVDVSEQYYPQPKGGALAKLRGYVNGFASLLRQIPANDGDVYHLTGLYKHFILAEWLLLRKARRQRLKVIYDVRAGSMYKHYKRLGPMYRWLFRRALRAADLVMVEGTDYDPFVREVTGRPSFYLPNHIPVSAMPQRTAGSVSTLELVYIGRVNVEKGVETALQTYLALKASGIDCSLTVAGPGSPELVARLQQQYPGAHWPGPIPSDQVLALLGRSHIFLFPTRHPGEGHSNALTEAMAMGCVPVATDNGFNKSVIGTAGIVLPFDAPARDYADAIASLWANGRWEQLSAAAAERTRQHFSTEKAVARLASAYTNLLDVRP
ncbi:glycosyltransferase family 4 protein [Pseudoduganella lutea]|nr:glycosyltransferase family 4 protein [Pseudoduganella lutea]